MFIVEHPVLSLIITLAVLILFKLLFVFLNFLEKLKGKSKDGDKKDSKSESVKTDAKSSDSDKSNGKSSDGNASKSDAKFSSENYLYDRFVVTPTKDDSKKNEDHICNAFLEDKTAEEIKTNKVHIEVQPVELEEEKKTRVYQILQKYEDKDKLLEDFDKMPKEMKILMLENILKRM